MKGKQTIKILNCCPQTRQSLTYLHHQIAFSSSPSFLLLSVVATELVNHPGYLILKTQSYQLLLQLFHPFRKSRGREKRREKERKGEKRERERGRERKGERMWDCYTCFLYHTNSRLASFLSFCPYLLTHLDSMKHVTSQTWRYQNTANKRQWYPFSFPKED